MEHVSHDIARAVAKGHGLRFMNEEWNESISNGDPFTLQWNESLGDQATELGVLRVTYPADGLVLYELVSNLTGAVSGTSIAWTPEHLADELYVVWLKTVYEGEDVWTLSPPWTPIDEQTDNEPHWFSALGAPIIVLLSLYAIGVLTCFCHHRRKRARKRALREETDEEEDAQEDVRRHGSVDSATTTNTQSEPEETRKPETWEFLDSPHREARRPSDGTLTVQSSERMSEETAVASQRLLRLPPDSVKMAVDEDETEADSPRAGTSRNRKKRTRRAAAGTGRPKSW